MNAVIDIAGWTLVSFLWQGAAIGLLTAAALRVARRAPAAVRYAIACAGLVGMVAAPSLTAFSLQQSPATEHRIAPRTPLASVMQGAPRAGISSRGAGSSQPGTLQGGVDAGPMAAATGPQNWFPAIVTFWLAGVVALTVRTAGGWSRVRRLQKISLASPSSRWQPVVERLALQLGVHRIIHVAECALVDTPAVVGWVRPVIVLPLAALANLTPCQADAILAHEIAHIRRHDYLVNLLQTLAETLLFYHPAVWWVSGQVRAEREHCCDDVALLVCGDAVEYAEALAEIESRRPVNALALAATGGSLLRRIQRMLGAPVPHDSRLTHSAAALVLAVVVTAGAATLAQVRPSAPVAPAQPAAQAPPAAPSAPVPPTPAVPFELPADSDFQTQSRDIVRNLAVRGKGAMTFTDDLTDVRSMGDGAYLTLRDRNWLTVRSLELRGERGTITRRYYVSGFEQPWEPEGRLWLADRLPSLIRRSGLAVEARTRRILSVSGVDGVLAEIKRVETDYVRRLYFQALLEAAPGTIDAEAAVRIVTLAGQVIRSDFELRQTLDAAAPLVAADAAGVKAYVDATTSIGSDFERRQALDALVQSRTLAAGAIESGAESAAAMRSDFEKRQSLSHMLDASGASGVEARKAILVAAASIRSDFECATLLMEFTDGHGIEADLADPFFAAVRTINSDFEQGRVLKSLPRRQTLRPEILRSALEAVGDMNSDFEQAEVLLSLLKGQPIDASARAAFIAAADGIQSDFEQTRVLAALVRAERR